MANIDGKVFKSMIGSIVRYSTYRLLIYIWVIWLSIGLCLLYYMRCFPDKCKLRSKEVQLSFDTNIMSDNNINDVFRANFSLSYSPNLLRSWNEPGMDVSIDCTSLRIIELCLK